MKKLKCILPLLLLAMLVACEKVNFSKDTSFTAVVKDITTGHLKGQVNVDLIEIETPLMPFTPLNGRLVETFDVNVNEPFSYDFKARRRQRFEYVLRFNWQGKSYGSTASSNGFFYTMKDEVKLTKHEPNDCVLEIVPTCRVTKKAVNVGDATELDSISVVMSDGNADSRLGYQGNYQSPSSEVPLAHGFYTLKIQTFHGRTLLNTELSNVELKQGQDTTMVFEF